MIAPPVWVHELAARFWATAGPPPAFPRDLTRAVTAALRLSLVGRPGLSLAVVRAYLDRLGVPVPFWGPDRPLRAALYCWRGTGFLFLDENDPPAERRFSLAHEVAHYLRDCDDLRRRAVRALGPAGLEILNGRTPTTDERIAAVLRDLSLHPHAHLMSRNADGRPSGEAERDAESRADRLAFELLAPAELLTDEHEPSALVARLETVYGLPPAAAREYADHLVPLPPLDPLLARLGGQV